MSQTQTRTGGIKAKYVAFIVLPIAVGATIIWLWSTRLGPYIDTVPSRVIAYIGLATLVATCAGMYLWRRASLWRLRRAERTAREALLAKVLQTADEADAKLMRLAAVILAWSIRAEMVREDMRDVEEYMLSLAKRREIRRVLVARRDGLVIAATDKSLRNQKLNRVMDGLPTETSDIQSTRISGRILRLIVPVMGLESRLGTLVLEHEQPDVVALGKAA